MPPRSRQMLLIPSVLWLSWLVMTFVHEAGHVAGAICTGGTVQRVVWHPLVLSRTDVDPNPHPLIEVWAGPVLGIVVPLLLALLASGLRWKMSFLVWAIAGFCLLANGAYVGIGAIDPVGDAREMILHGMPRWPMALFGAAAVTAGLWIWNHVSPRFGFGAASRPIDLKAVHVTIIATVLVTIVGLVAGQRG